MSYVGEFIGLGVAIGVGAFAFAYIAIWNYQEEQLAKTIPKPLLEYTEPKNNLSITRNDVIKYQMEKEKEKLAEIQRFARTLTYEQIPLNQRLTVEYWGQKKANIIIRQKQLKVINNSQNVILTAENADGTPAFLSPLIIDPTTRIVKNTIFSIQR
jgi:hypothetical protein